MPAYVDARPPGLSLDFRPGNALTVTLDWPTGSLAGRTFSSTLGTSSLTVSVSGDTMTVEATTTQTNSVSVPTAWSLLETLDGVAQPIIVGTWAPSNLAAVNNVAVQVVTEPNVTVDVTVTSGTASLIAHEQVPDAHRPLSALSRVRADLARTRSGTAGDTDARSTAIAIVGDSLTEAFTPTKRGLMWTRHLARRLNGSRMSSVQYIPAAANAFSTVVASDWPGSQAPVTYTGSTAGSVIYGGDLHATVMQSGATATVTFFGEVIGVVYVRTTTGPSAAAVTLDGVAQTAINANGSELPGQQATFVAPGYGFHTLVVTATAAPLILEGFTVHDGEIFGFGVPCRAVRTYAFGHSGFQTQQFVNAANWATSVAALTCNSALTTHLSLAIIALGANDSGASVTASTFRANLQTIMGQLDTAINATGVTRDPDFLLMAMAGLPDSYVDAMWTARSNYGSDRVGVLDVRSYLPGGGATWDIMDSTPAGHPIDSGQLWLSNLVADWIDGDSGVRTPAPTRNDIVIEAVTPATYRSGWTESLALTGASGGEVYDASPADAGANERVHREWLDRGTYQARLRYGEVTTTGGQAEVLVAGSTLGTQSTTGTTGNIGEATLGSTVTIDSPGAYPVVIRCTTANSAVFRFIRLYLRRTA